MSRIAFQLFETHFAQQVPSIIVSIQDRKYIINVPPGFQRFIKSHRIKFPIGPTFLFTKTDASTMSGLSGLMLSSFDMGACSNCKMYVNDKMFEYFQHLRYKMGFKVLPISATSFSGKTIFGINKSPEDIKKMAGIQSFHKAINKPNEFVVQNTEKKDINDSGKFYNSDKQFIQNDDFKIIPFTIHSKSEEITNYIFIGNKVAGRMIKEKLKELGIEGKLIGKLIANGQIEVNGNITKIEQVQQKEMPANNFLILHFNTIESVVKTLENKIFNDYFQNKEFYTAAIVHIIEKSEIVQSAEFKQLLKCFSKEIQHVLYNRNYKNMEDTTQQLLSSTRHMEFVSEISKFFPSFMPNILIQHTDYLSTKKLKVIEEIYPYYRIQMYKKKYEVITSSRSNVCYKINQIDASKKEGLSFDNNLIIPEVSICQEMKQKFMKFDPKVIFLGTGSMKPSKYRNVSAIFVEWDKQNSVMMDCGQGTYLQVANHYGFQKVDEIILSLRIIFITHIHSDHNLGILQVISERNKLLKKYNRKDKLFLIIPSNVFTWFYYFCKDIQNLFEGCEVLFIQSLSKQNLQFEGTMSKEERIDVSCPIKKSENQMIDQQSESQMKEQKSEVNQQEEDSQDQTLFYKDEESEKLISQFYQQQEKVKKMFQNYLKSIQMSKFFPTPVEHCPQSYGIIIEHITGIKISYSGDTRPIQSFAQAAKNSTLMIHQATFGDDLAKNAHRHYHTTVGQAIQIGMKSNSWKTALTHFSQRYQSAVDIADPKMYKKDEDKCQYTKNHTFVCFDHLCTKLSETPLLPFVTRAIANAFPEQ